MGLVPHKAAKDASLRIRSGLSSATISSSASSSAISVLSVWCRRGRAQRPLGCGLDDVGAGVGAQTGADVYDVAGA